MSRVLVTGGAGFVGSHLVKILCDEGHEVFVIDSFTQYIEPPIDNIYLYNVNYRFEKLLKDAQILRGNTHNKDEIRRRILKIKPEYIVHFAALPLANIAIEYSEEAFETIVGGTVNLLEVLRDMDFITKFVYISSSMVYGDFKVTPIPEDCEKEPKEIYGGMKLAGEYMVKVYSQRYEIPYSIVRPSAVYGPTDNNRRVVGLFLTNAVKGKKIRAKNADTTLLDFSFVEDVADGIKLVTLSGKANNETFNITRGRSRSLKELVTTIGNMYPEIEIEFVEGGTFRPNRGALDVTKAKELLNYRPKIEIEEGVKRYATFLEKAHKTGEGSK
ncbi:MAG: NAD-dependent epimerase/dehydratase family protein [Chitinivibrionales bacterium]|nr:NAD-dependent epimerase/dehydratase family protein [Chitinivibrionales bacterium]